MHELSRLFLSANSAAAINQTYKQCDRWAVARRTMQDGFAYSLDDYPYVREILNSRARKNWIMKAAQTGLSEAAITISLWEIDVNARDVIYYFPTGKLAERFSKTRFSNAIKLSPYLRDVVRNDSVEIKQIGQPYISLARTALPT
jgi:phage terminase large subunit GpA-like protein